MEAFTYRGFRIDYDPPPIPSRNCDWHWVHEEYDGPEDNRCGHAASEEEAKREVDDWIEENFDCRCSASDPDACMALVCKWRRPSAMAVASVWRSDALQAAADIVTRYFGDDGRACVADILALTPQGART